MDNDSIIEVLDEWNFWNKDIDAGIYREGYLSRLESLTATGQVVAVTGVRRSGKSTLMKQFIKRRISSGMDRKSFLYVNFEEPKFAGMLSVDLMQQIFDAYMEIVHPSGVPHLLLDEVQNVPGWERFVRGLHEKGQARILITGSTSSLLGRELGTLLTGRWVELRVYPLDLKEFLGFRGVKIGGKLDMLAQKTKVRHLLREYMEIGGFPLVALADERSEIVQRYFEDIVGRGVAERHSIRNVEKLRALARYYLSNITSPASYGKIAKFIGLSLDSVERFSSYLRDANMVFFVPKFSYSLKEQTVNPRHVYCIDSGLANMASFRFSDNIGNLYENAVFLSLMRKGCEIYYYKGERECDFVVKEGQKVTQAIQVSYDMKENGEREVEGLAEVMKAFGLREGLIITDREEGAVKLPGGKTVRLVPLWKWLLAG